MAGVGEVLVVSQVDLFHIRYLFELVSFSYHSVMLPFAILILVGYEWLRCGHRVIISPLVVNLVTAVEYLAT